MDVFRRLANAALDRLVPRVEAGACVPNTGDQCWNGNYEYRCDGDTHLKYRRKIFRFVQCDGACAGGTTYGPWVSYTRC